MMVSGGSVEREERMERMEREERMERMERTEKGERGERFPFCPLSPLPRPIHSHATASMGARKLPPPNPKSGAEPVFSITQSYTRSI